MLSAAILIALPLAADDQKPAAKQPATAAQTAASQPSGNAGAPPQLTSQSQTGEDSPLVAAAKRTKRGAKKSAIVITNETLAGKGAHVTTTASQKSIAVPAPPAGGGWGNLELNQVAAQRQAKMEREAEATKKASAQEARKKRMAQLAARYEDDSMAPESDPALIEHELGTQASPTSQPQPTQPPQKP
jgi:hypothetical protein